MKTSVSWAAWMSLAFVSGVVLMGTSGWRAAFLLAVLLGALELYWRSAARPPKISLPWLAMLAAVLLGALRYSMALPRITPFHIAWFNDRAYSLWVSGVLAEPPDVRDTYTHLRINVQAVDTGDGDLPAEGLLLARVNATDLDVTYGDRVRVRGYVQTPPEDEDFSYRDYLARQGIYAYIPSASFTRLPGWQGWLWLKWVYAFKARAVDMVYRLYPDPEASLLAGILLGVDSGLSADLQQAFKDTGTSHIIAISGFNIAIIAGIFVMLFSRILGTRRGAWAALLGIVLYTILVGADAAVVRAAVMGSLTIFARQVGRRQEGLSTLMLVAGLMTLANPNVPWDIGFQLSFAATLGLMLYGARWQNAAETLLARWLSAEKARRGAALLSEYILLTFAAQLTTLPIMVYHFRRLSLISLLANPFILPVQPAVMVLGGMAVLAGLLYVPLGHLLAGLAWPFIVYTIRMVEFFARFPHGVLVLGELSLLLALLYYLILFTLPYTWPRRHAISLPLIFTGVALLTWLVWRAVFLQPDGLLRMTFLDVGSADAVLIQTPSGETVLLNGGESAHTLADDLGRRLPFGRRQLDALVVASTASWQIDALPRVMALYPPEMILWGGETQASAASRHLYAWAAGQSVPLRLAERGDVLDLGAGAVLQVVDVSARGLTLLLTWRDFRALLPIGAAPDTLEALQRGRALGPLNVLLLPESGYAALTPADWLNYLNPQLVIISVAAGDPFGMPAPETLERLAPYSVLRTDWYGTISIATDGEKMWIHVEKTP